MKILTTFAAVAVVAAFGAAATFAQTPDEQTPANEGVCDELIGGTPGLFGLCIAYCEAQDLDEFGEAKMSNPRLLAVYAKKQRVGDPDMPCVQEPCPCWSAEEISVANWGNETSFPFCTTSSASLTISEPDHRALSSFNPTSKSGNSCSYSDFRLIPTIRRGFRLEIEEGAICRDQAAALCSDLGF